MIEQLEIQYISPGYKEPEGASKENAKRQKPEVLNFRRRKAMSFFRAYPKGLTSDEVADLMNENILAIRPRVSELRTLERIESTGERRKSANGNASTVWRIK